MESEKKRKNSPSYHVRQSVLLRTLATSCCIRSQRKKKREGRNSLLLPFERGSSITLIARDRPWLSDCEGIRPRFSWEITVWDATLRPHVRVPKKRGTRSEANEVQIEESAPRDGRNPLDRPRSNIRANSFGRGPQRDTPAAWIVRCPAAVSSSPSPHVEMESKRESGELWKWRASLARNSLSRDGQRKGKRFGFLPWERRRRRRVLM